MPDTPGTRPASSPAETGQQGERLQRVLAGAGVASRRASEEVIRSGRVTVNGKVILEMGVRVDPSHDDIRVDGKPLRKQQPRYLMLNKPTGFITTVKDERQRWTIMDLVRVPERIYPVGRLDRDTQGLLLLTNDGNIANRVMHPRYGLTKEYHVITSSRPSDQQLRLLADGVMVAGRLVVPDECRLLRETTEGLTVKIVLHEGLYHVVRVMMESVGIVVHRLRRVRLGPLSMQGIPPGSWRDLTPGELVQLFEALSLPTSEADAINARRQMQLSPMGGFRHTIDARPADALNRPGPPVGRGSAPASTGRRNDGVRPPAGHRNRRPGGRG